jgi:acyl carrier protein
MSSFTAPAVQGWLVARLASMIGVPAQSIDVRERFSRQGLDSLKAVGLVSALSQHLGRPLSPTIVWEHPTIEALGAHLTGEAAHSGSATAAEEASQAWDASEPIAIVGMAGRFPGAPDVASFWRLLRDGVDAVSEAPRGRWDAAALFDADPKAPGKLSTRWGGFLDQVDRFDPHFFGISPREAMHIDPQQRLALELAWEALEDAGIPPRGLSGSRTAVLMGAMWVDYARIPGGDLGFITQHTATGQDLSIVPARISYTLGLRGPCLAVNTACSSSLVAVHLARSSLLSGECDLALAGGVNLMLSPHSTVLMSKFGAMAPDGRSKAFDAVKAAGSWSSSGCRERSLPGTESTRSCAAAPSTTMVRATA